jgi:hypothetical protein
MSFQPTYDALTHANLKAVPFPQVSIAEASLTSSYQAIGGKAFATPMIIVIIVSTLNDTVQWSWDGINPAFPVIAGATIIVDLKSDNIVLPASYGPYVKTLGSPSAGSLYVGGFSV